VSFADQLTVARAAVVPLVVLLYVWDFPGHDYWATALFRGPRWRRTGSMAGLLAAAAGHQRWARSSIRSPTS
jgi:hypothetical protein